MTLYLHSIIKKIVYSEFIDFKLQYNFSLRDLLKQMKL